MWPVYRLNELTDDVGSRRVGELRQLLQMLISRLARAKSLPRRADENGALDWCLNRDELFADNYLPRVLYLPVCEYGIVKLPTGVPTVTSPLTL